MPKTKLAAAKGSKTKRVKYTEPFITNLKELRENAKVKTTHKVMQMWIRALEEFRSEVGYEGKIEEVSSKAVLEDQLSKFVYAMKRKDSGEYHASSVYFDLNQVINEKVKDLSAQGLGKRVGADGLTLSEVEQILDHPMMQRNMPEGLLRRIFFYNATLLALCGGEHYTLQINSFIKRFDDDIDVKLFKSKTNQRGFENYNAQAEAISLPNIKSIVNDYEFYFVKHLMTTVTNFYLIPTLSDSVEFNGQWYYARALGERKLREYFRGICEITGIQIGTRNISNHLERKTTMQLLKELGLAAYECPKYVMQHEGLSGFFNALKQVSKAPHDHENDTPSDHENDASNDHENDAPSDHESNASNSHENDASNDHAAPTSKSHRKVTPVTGNFSLASSFIRRTDSQMSLINALNNLEVISEEPSNALTERDVNILDMDRKKEKAKGMDGRKEVNKGGKDLKNEFFEKFLA
ncbi:13962_t:CDS:2, partial [Cetraspora pellucida]